MGPLAPRRSRRSFASQPLLLRSSMSKGCFSSMSGRRSRSRDCFSSMSGRRSRSRDCFSSTSGRRSRSRGCCSSMSGRRSRSRGCCSSMSGSRRRSRSRSCCSSWRCWSCPLGHDHLRVPADLLIPETTPSGGRQASKLHLPAVLHAWHVPDHFVARV